jgi:hypothetical protein
MDDNILRVDADAALMSVAVLYRSGVIYDKKADCHVQVVSVNVQVEHIHFSPDGFGDGGRQLAGWIAQAKAMGKDTLHIYF